MYEWTVVYGWPGIRIMYQSGVTCMSGLLFTLAGNQDNVSEWSDMYGWTVVYGWPGIRIMYQSGVTCMSGLLFTVGR